MIFGSWIYLCNNHLKQDVKHIHNPRKFHHAPFLLNLYPQRPQLESESDHNTLELHFNTLTLEVKNVNISYFL